MGDESDLTCIALHADDIDRKCYAVQLTAGFPNGIDDREHIPWLPGRGRLAPDADAVHVNLIGRRHPASSNHHNHVAGKIDRRCGHGVRLRGRGPPP
jgi:hypothetical protein